MNEALRDLIGVDRNIHEPARLVIVATLSAVDEADFLKQMIPYFADNPDTGCLQARWGHINPDSSWLTRAQATGIDGHFIIEQETRSERGFFLNFNGTAGIWRQPERG